MGQILSNITKCLCGDQLDVEERLVHQLLPLSSSTPESSTPYACSIELEPKERVFHRVLPLSPSAPEGTLASVFSDQLQPKERQVHPLLTPSSSALENTFASVFSDQQQPKEKRVHQLLPPASSAPETLTASVSSNQLEPEERVFPSVFSNPLPAKKERQVHLTPSSVPECVTASVCSNELEPKENIFASVFSSPLQSKESKKLGYSQVLPGNPQETETRETHQIRSRKSKPIQPTVIVPGQVDKPIVVKEKRIKHYTCNQKILLLGEGDFSFSACLAEAFGSAANIVATSLNSLEFLNKNYGGASDNIQKLKMLGCQVCHGVDATKIGDKKSMFKGKIYDRIIFNFPHAGFSKKNDSREVQIREHQKLVRGFLKNAKKLIQCEGEIHISHMTSKFHSEWNLEELGSAVGLRLLGKARFKRSDYPGYNSKYGFGGDGNFDCNPSNTYMFGLPIAPSSNGL